MNPKRPREAPTNEFPKLGQVWSKLTLGAVVRMEFAVDSSEFQLRENQDGLSAPARAGAGSLSDAPIMAVRRGGVWPPTEAGPGEGLPGSLAFPEQRPSLWDRSVKLYGRQYCPIL
jgi:hypothetical protein